MRVRVARPYNIVNAEIAAAAAIAYSKLALTGGIVNADIAAAAAIVYSKLALTGGIVNADIAAAAAIADSKLESIVAVSSMGSYTGDNAISRHIAHGLGKVPKFVFIFSVTVIFCWFLPPNWDNMLVWVDAGTNGFLITESLTTTYFSVGAAASLAHSANLAPLVYSWVAIG